MPARCAATARDQQLRFPKGYPILCLFEVKQNEARSRQPPQNCHTQGFATSELKRVFHFIVEVYFIRGGSTSDIFSGTILFPTLPPPYMDNDLFSSYLAGEVGCDVFFRFSNFL